MNKLRFKGYVSEINAAKQGVNVYGEFEIEPTNEQLKDLTAVERVHAVETNNSNVMFDCERPDWISLCDAIKLSCLRIEEANERRNKCVQNEHVKN